MGKHDEVYYDLGLALVILVYFKIQSTALRRFGEGFEEKKNRSRSGVVI